MQNLLNSMLHTHDVTCKSSRQNNRNNDIFEKDQHFEEIVYLKEILHNFSFPVTMCIFISTRYWS